MVYHEPNPQITRIELEKQMLSYSSFHYLLSTTADADGTHNSTFDALMASGDQLLVLETELTSVEQRSILTASQLQALQDDGRTVLGYVNLTVTDHTRTYWRDDWVVPGTYPSDNHDAGTPRATAPDWFANPIGLATGPGGVVYGPIVNFRDPAWQQIVIDQAVATVEAGYSGVFLDDIARYYQGDNALTTELANEVMSFVNDVADAVHAVDPDAVIITNGGPYLRWDADTAAGNSFDWWEYLSNVDGFLYEYVEAGQDAGNWAEFTDNYFDFLNFLYIVDESLVRDGDRAKLTALGVTLEEVANPDYDELPPSGTMTPPTEATTISSQVVWIDGVKTTLVRGTGGDDLIDLSALTNRAIVYGLDGNDTILGTSYDDLIFAGSGDDSVQAGAGDDIILGAAGRDSLFGGTGDDTLSGGTEGDLLSGEDGADMLYGGDLPDDFVF